jgi:UDP-3-O-[3-hydroxymyristoyl] glucosamine N-acyltransferase
MSHNKIVHIIGKGKQSEIVSEILMNQGYCRQTIEDSGNEKSYKPGSYFVVAIGNNRARLDIHNTCKELGLVALNVIHPSAVISPSANIGYGVQILEMAVVSCKAIVDEACIVNVHSLVGHHSKMYPGSSISANCVLGASSTLGYRSFLGNAANTVPGVQIVKDVLVGAGGLVIEDILVPGTYIGMPVRKVK